MVNNKLSMKKTFLLVVLAIAFISCKNESKSKDAKIIEERVADQKSDNDGLTILKGQFVYYGDAAVLQTPDEIYGVFVTDKMLELNKSLQQYKKEPTDMVQVEIKGKITNKKDEIILWENKVEIIEILNITPITKENTNVIKLGQE